MIYQFVHEDNESTWGLTQEQATAMLAAEPTGRVFAFEDGVYTGYETQAAIEDGSGPTD